MIIWPTKSGKCKASSGCVSSAPSLIHPWILMSHRLPWVTSAQSTILKVLYTYESLQRERVLIHHILCMHTNMHWHAYTRWHRHTRWHRQTHPQTDPHWQRLTYTLQFKLQPSFISVDINTTCFQDKTAILQTLKWVRRAYSAISLFSKTTFNSSVSS